MNDGPALAAVLDASGLLALLQAEPGHELVAQAVEAGAAMSAVNLSETVAKLSSQGLPDAAIREALASIAVQIVPFDEALALEAGFLREPTKAWGLSLGDRACLALARRLGLPVLTTDRAWARLQLGIQVQVIR